MNNKMLWAAALTMPITFAGPLLAQPAAGPAGTASVPAEKMAPVTPTAPAGKPGMSAGMAPSMAATNLAPADKRFVEKAAEGGMMEVQAGQIAQQNASDQKVKDFGGKMVTDHTANNAKLTALAQQKGMTLPTVLDAKDQAELTKMQGMSGAKFDKAYLKAQVAGHEKMLKLMNMEAKSGKDSDLKSFAADTAPTVQEHLDAAKQGGSM